jgi:hypothetical protein
MASPAEPGQAPAALGLFRHAPSDADLASELDRLGNAELLRLELANWLLGAAAMQVLMAETTAAGAGVDPARITRAAWRLLSGASCDHDDHTKVVFAQLLARQLEHLLMVLTAESVKGRVVLPLLIQPSMLIASHLAALLQAGSGSLSGTVTGYPGQVRQAADGLKGAAEVLEEMAARASQAREFTLTASSREREPESPAPALLRSGPVGKQRAPGRQIVDLECL